MKFLVIFVALTLVISTTQARRKYCGSRLVDQLEFICGRSGIRSMRNYHIYMKYPNLRRGYTRHRRSASEVFARLAPVDQGKTFVQAVLEKPSKASLFRTMIRIAHDMRREEVERKRHRRSLTSECCRRDCNLMEVKKKYCGRRYTYRSK